MDYMLIANILLAVTAFFALALMLRGDMHSLQKCDYSIKKFLEWLQSSDESYSIKRIVAMAALVASATPWARQSWMVVIILAIVMAGVAISILRIKLEPPLRYTKSVVFTLLASLALAALCAVSLFSAHFSLEADMLLMLFTAFSYVLALGITLMAHALYKIPHWHSTSKAPKDKQEKQNIQSTKQDEEI